MTSVAKTTIALGTKIAKEGTKAALKSNPWTMLVGAVLDIVDAGANIVQTVASASAAATRGKSQGAVEKILSGVSNTTEGSVNAIDRIKTAGERIQAQREEAQNEPEPPAASA